MTTEFRGLMSWSGTRDAEGHREYKARFLVASDTTDGPANVMRTVGLPLPGDEWLVSADADIWAWCQYTASVNIHQEKEGDPNRHWVVEQIFSSKPPSRTRCNDTDVDDPILEPAKLSGGFSKYNLEVAYDRFGFPLTNSAHEQLRGPQVEFDYNRPTVKIEFNVPVLNLWLYTRMIDHVNYDTLWGFPRRCVKLSNVSWERKYYGKCYVYYTISLEFDFRYETFDRDVLDEGTKALHGQNVSGEWVLKNFPSGEMPSRYNPMHFVRYKDSHGENARCILDGYGVPAGIVTVKYPTGVSRNTRYVAIQDGANHALTDTAYWLIQNGDMTAWVDDENFQRGDVVGHDDGVGDGLKFYMCLLANIDSEPPHGTSNSFWKYLPNGLRDKGSWSSTTAYVIGDRVTSNLPGTGTFPTNYPAGFRHVEVYPEADFLMLGVPTQIR